MKCISGEAICHESDIFKKIDIYVVSGADDVIRYSLFIDKIFANLFESLQACIDHLRKFGELSLVEIKENNNAKI